MNSEAPIAAMNFVRSRIDFQQQIVKAGHWQCCMNCTEFDTQKEFCNVHNAKPPIYIALHGCERFLMDIPF